jgi:hypothetical protein
MTSISENNKISEEDTEISKKNIEFVVLFNNKENQHEGENSDKHYRYISNDHFDTDKVDKVDKRIKIGYRKTEEIDHFEKIQEYLKKMNDAN